MSSMPSGSESGIELGIRTAVRPIFEGTVRGIRAEDLDGWFGIRPGRRDLAAVLPPGLLLFEDEAGEGFAAISGGLLDLHDGSCRVMVRDAVLARELEQIEDQLAIHLQRRRERPAAQRDVFDALAKEALKRLRHQGRNR